MSSTRSGYLMFKKAGSELSSLIGVILLTLEGKREFLLKALFYRATGLGKSDVSLSGLDIVGLII